jgi:hypothetical protein
MVLSAEWALIIISLKAYGFANCCICLVHPRQEAVTSQITVSYILKDLTAIFPVVPNLLVWYRAETSNLF